MNKRKGNKANKDRGIRIGYLLFFTVALLVLQAAVSFAQTPEETERNDGALASVQPLEGIVAGTRNGGPGFSADNPMELPEEAMAIVGGTYYGILESWFQTNNPNQETMYFSVTIPDSVKTIANDAFRYNYTSGKKSNRVVTPNSNLGECQTVAIDFSNATSLEVIGYQAAKNNTWLTGVLDLSNTKMKRIEQNAFGDCTGLTGVILPDTLETLGTQGGSGDGGSVFVKCSGLEFIRTKGSEEGTVFELPEGLRFIGNQTFQDAFASNAEIVTYLPASLEKVGSQAFYSGFSQIFITRPSDEGYTNYHSRAFKTKSAKGCLLIFQDQKGYNNTGSFTGATKTYPVMLRFQGSVEQTKLYKQSIQYEYNQEAKKWVKNPNYTLPEIPDVENKPGYDAGWKIDGDTKILTNTSTVNGWPDAALPVRLESDSVVSKPTIQFRQGDQIIADNQTVPTLLAEIEDGKPAYVGLEVTHPLATPEAKESGTYVYFRYSWWDEEGDSPNGTRSQEEPELFSTAITSASYQRVLTEQSVIPITKAEHARVDGDYYMVEVFGYYVKDGVEQGKYYQSAHNFIGGIFTHTDPRCYLMHVSVTEFVTISATAKGQGTITPEGTVKLKQGESQTFTITPQEGYVIADVLVNGKSVGAVEEYTFSNVMDHQTIEAIFEPSSSGGASGGGGGSGHIDTYYVIYHDGEEEVKEGKFYHGQKIEAAENPFSAPKGFVFAGWSKEAGGTADFLPGKKFTMPDETYHLYAVWAEGEAYHAPYLNGYPDGTIRPEQTITRAETAMLFYQLLGAPQQETGKGFYDVPKDSWYGMAVRTLAGRGILSGYPDGAFCPDAPITRAEFVTMATAFAKAQPGTDVLFPDVPVMAWYAGFVAAAVEQDWISGYPDGTFRPEQAITRAEVVSILNRMTDRAADLDFIAEQETTLRTFLDLPKTHWAYGLMMEAANGHAYIRNEDKTETWKK